MRQAIMRYSLDQSALEGIRVGIFRNLTRKCYSVKALSGEYKGKVIAYLPLDSEFSLTNVKFSVGEKTRDRVRAEGKKYIHALVTGELQDRALSRPDFRVTYNPYTHDYFQTCVNGTDYAIHAADEAIFWGGRVYAAGTIQFNELGAAA